MNRTEYAEQISSAFGSRKADLVLKHASIVNVFTEEIEKGDIAITNGKIVGIGDYAGETEIELNGAYVCPGLIDGHIHLESSMILPQEFEACVLPHGTTAVVTDPHEIANVAGTEGIRFMLDQTKDLIMDVFFMLSSCVPASSLDESSACLLAKDLEPFYQEKRVLGLAEVMDAYDMVRGDSDMLDKMYDALSHGKYIDGHGPFLLGKELNAYATAGVTTDHECSDLNEALEKMRRGQWIMVREGTAAHNVEALMGIFKAPYYHRAMLVTDDKHPDELLRGGHIDAIIRKAVKLGADPIKAIKMGSLHAAQHFGMTDKGAVAPGYSADLAVFSDLYDFKVEKVFKNGVLVAENGKCIAKNENGAQKRPVDTDAAGMSKNNAQNMADNVLPKADTAELTAQKKMYRDKFPNVFASFHMPQLTEADFRLEKEGAVYQRVIELIPHEVLTKERICELHTAKEGCAAGVDTDRDIVKLAAVERHKSNGHIGLGFMGGYGLKCGAVASSFAHDSHNLIIAGTNDLDMMCAGNCVRENGGGLAIALDGHVVAALPLPVGGLMSDQSVVWTDQKLEEMKHILWKMGIREGVDPFMTLAFVSLPVIPALRLNTYGIVDVNKQKIVPALLLEKDETR